jgi:hypothetical protein
MVVSPQKRKKFKKSFFTAFLAIFQRSRHRSAPLPTPGAGTSTVTVTSTCTVTGTGTDRPRPAPTGTDQHGPAPTGTGPAPCRHDIYFDYLVVNNDKYQFLKFFFHLNRSKS